MKAPYHSVIPRRGTLTYIEIVLRCLYMIQKVPVILNNVFGAGICLGRHIYVWGYFGVLDRELIINVEVTRDKPSSRLKQPAEEASIFWRSLVIASRLPPLV